MKKKPNGLNFNIRQSSLHYTRILGFKANDRWKYKGVLHEYATNEKAGNIIIDVPEFIVESRRLGDRTIKNPEMKMKKDISLLLDGLKEEPTNERYLFYLAQSYRDDGQMDKALEFYTKRYEIGGWYEERFISAYQIVKITNSKEWVWKAHEIDPKRLEAFHSYFNYCIQNDKYNHETYAMALYASGISMPKNALFVESDVYDWRIFDDLSIIAYYTGHKDVALLASSKLLSENKFPPNQLERILKNKSYSV
jgi:tetratricopeptide (TPR) repeat protein